MAGMSPVGYFQRKPFLWGVPIKSAFLQGNWCLLASFSTDYQVFWFFPCFLAKELERSCYRRQCQVLIPLDCAWWIVRTRCWSSGSIGLSEEVREAGTQQGRNRWRNCHQLQPTGRRRSSKRGIFLLSVSGLFPIHKCLYFTGDGWDTKLLRRWRAAPNCENIR